MGRHTRRHHEFLSRTLRRRPKVLSMHGGLELLEALDLGVHAILLRAVPSTC